MNGDLSLSISSVYPDLHREWQSARDKLSHDILKNCLSPMVSGFINCLRGLVSTLDSPAQWARIYDEQWEQFAVDLEKLTETCIKACSPKTHFEHQPLCYCDLNTKKWLGAFLHLRWLRESKVYEQLDSLSKRLAECELAWRALEATILDENQAELHDTSTLLLAENLLAALGDLSNALSALGKLKYV